MSTSMRCLLRQSFQHSPAQVNNHSKDLLIADAVPAILQWGADGFIQPRCRLRNVGDRPWPLFPKLPASEVSGSLRGAVAKCAGGRKPKTIHA
eukprot:15474888-Alexandrium_andersonii.AAC.1